MTNLAKGNDSQSIFQKLFQSLSGNLLTTTNGLTSFQGSSFNTLLYFADKISSIFLQRTITQEMNIILTRKKYVSAIHEISKH